MLVLTTALIAGLGSFVMAQVPTPVAAVRATEAAHSMLDALRLSRSGLRSLAARITVGVRQLTEVPPTPPAADTEGPATR